MRFLLIVVVIVVAACHGKSDGPSCGTVGGRFFTFAKDDLDHSSIDDQTRRAVGDQLPAMRDQLAIACSDGKWSGEVRTCMGSAADHAAFQACETQLTNDQRKALDQAASATPPSK
jgi:hypothetical protein